MLCETFCTIFILSCFIGYYVILKVTSALHAPLMAVTNAISSIIIVMGLNIIQNYSNGTVFWLGILSIFLATINIVGGLVITSRMLNLFDNKNK